MPAGAAPPDGPRVVSARLRVTALLPWLLYVTVLVRIGSSPCGKVCRPRLMLAGWARTDCWYPCPMSSRPEPCSYAPSEAFGTAVPMRADLIWVADQPGRRCFMMAAAPATCGVAIEVPLSVMYPLVPARAAVMS